MFDIGYRLWLLRQLSKLVLPPLVAVYGVLHLKGASPFVPKGLLARVTCYVVSLPTYWTLWIQLSNLRNKWEAKRRGAVLPPMIKSKRFGGLDLKDRLVNGMANDYAGSIFDELLDEVGADTARISILWAERVITRDPDVVKFVVSTGFPHFGKGEPAEVRFRSFLGKGIFASDGERWKMHRSLARPYFARERISDYNAFQHHSTKFCNILANHFSDPNAHAVDVQDLFARFTMDTAGDFLFGRKEFNTLDLPFSSPDIALPEGVKSALDEGGGEFARFVTAFEAAQLLVTRRMALGMYGWTIAEFFNDSVKKHMGIVDRYLDEVVEEAQARRREAQKAEGEGEREYDTFLDNLVDTTEDVQLIKDQLLNILLAARDTTAQLLAWTLYAFTQYPDILARLRAEILSKYGTSTVPTFENIKQLRYLRAVLDEVLRVFPPVPIEVRSPLHDHVVIPTRRLGKLYVPAEGTIFNWSIPSMHKSAEIWGEDASEFDPDRWIDERRKRISQGDGLFGFLPFNGGPRICLGQQFAYNEASFVLIRLLQHFDRFTLAQPKGAQPPESWKNALGGRKAVEKAWPKNAITLYAKGGMWIKMGLASEQ